MANRKVLINRHTSGNTAPTASEMYLGEIAVAHKTGEEIIWTKNNAGVMVPFITCAQTIAIIDSKVQASEDSVVAKAGEEHIEVESAGTADATIWQISSKDVQSESAFNDYSARTNEALTQLTTAFDALLNITVTGISGDTIIVAEPVENGTGSNSYNLTHKQAPDAVALGFNKLATDAYGHVTASTAVETADIQALGFKTSAETGEDLAELSASVVANETHISELSAGTIHDIETLSGDVVEYVKVVSGNIETVINSLSAGTVSEFNSAFTAINTLSADTEAAISAAIEGLDSETAVTAGKYMTGIAIADGKISGITEADLPKLASAVTGDGNVVTDIAVDDHTITFTKGITVAAADDLQALSAAVISFSAETVNEFASAFTAINNLSADTNAAIAQLSAGTIQLSADTKAAINALSGAVKVNETNINTVSGDVIELSAATVALGTGLGNLSAVTLTGVSLNNEPLAVSNHIVKVPVTTSGSGIANATDSGSVADAKAVKEYVEDVLSSSVDYKGATDNIPSNPVKGDLWIASSAFTIDGKNAEVGDFIIYNGNGWDVIEKNLDGAITGSLAQDTVVLGNGVNEVKYLANGSAGQVLTMVDGAPAWADDPELSSATTGTGNVVTSILVDDHEITYVKDFTAASNADLEVVSGIVDTFSAATVAEFNSAFTAINTLSANAHNSMIARDDDVFSSAVTYVDDAIDEVYASAVSYTDLAIAGLDSTGNVSTTGNYLTSVTITNGRITAVGEETLPANVTITATTETAVDTASAVLTSVVTGGTDGHELTFGKSNKIFSAETSDSALTSESALTAVHANAATKVDSALTINVLTSAGTTASTVTFDGSSTQSIDIPGSHDTATTQEGHYVPATAASAFTAPAGSFLSGVSVDDKNHVLEVAYADKVNSATTSESADTAAQVANALTMTDGTNSQSYNGSEAKSLTFGTATSISDENSMTMSSAGVVDVNIIDCGEY